ncbi:MAG: hypothetical protein FD123_2229 [Bacteroidetes bacterium]|nr:MAG: hypothetical protein FD123_2229 [Bacteroidota bacterium]
MKKLLLVPFVLFFALPAQSQDIHFSQFNESPLHLNPAYTGVFNGQYRVMMNYRNQWQSMGHPYQTMAAAFDMPLLTNRPAYMGAGLYLYRDKAGDSGMGILQALLSASAIVPIDGNSTLSAGLQGGFSQRSANISTLQWESQYQNGTYDPTLSPNENNLLTSFPYADFSGGVAYRYQSVADNLQGRDMWKINFGAAYFHLNKPRQKFYSGNDSRLNSRLVGHANGHFDFPGTKWSLQPSAVYMQQGPANEILLGTMIRYKLKNGTKTTSLLTESGVALGAHYRFGDAIIPQLYYDLGDIFIGLSYDVNTSTYSEASKAKGGFEITLRYANLNSALFKNKRPIH